MNRRSAIASLPSAWGRVSQMRSDAQKPLSVMNKGVCKRLRCAELQQSVATRFARMPLASRGTRCFSSRSARRTARIPKQICQKPNGHSFSAALSAGRIAL